MVVWHWDDNQWNLKDYWSENSIEIYRSCHPSRIEIRATYTDKYRLTIEVSGDKDRVRKFKDAWPKIVEAEYHGFIL